uniref:SERTA domain-containing protein n=1 Tax=Rhabditophanes sp. KR3021 TaxID=114890 RepID=A0AC35UAJ4_9BILA
MPIEEINDINEDVLSYMCTLAVQKCSKKLEKKRAACGGAAMRKRLLIKNFVACLLTHENLLRQKKEQQMLKERHMSDILDYECDEDGVYESQFEDSSLHEPMDIYDSQPQTELDDFEEEEVIGFEGDMCYEDNDKHLIINESSQYNSYEQYSPMDSIFDYQPLPTNNSYLDSEDESTDRLNTFNSTDLTSESSYLDLSTCESISIDSKNTTTDLFDEEPLGKKQKDEFEIFSSYTISPLKSVNCRSQIITRNEGRRSYTDMDTLNTVVEEGDPHLEGPSCDENFNASALMMGEVVTTSATNTFYTQYSYSEDDFNRKRSYSSRGEEDYLRTLNHLMLSPHKRIKL